MATRRQFLRVGFGAGLLLATARFLDAAPALAADSGRFLDAPRRAIVGALVPVVLEGTLPASAEARSRAVAEVIEAFDRAVSGLGLGAQGEVAELFAVLHYAPARVALTGLWTPVAQASPAQLAAFLEDWRASRLALKRAGYQALTQLLQASWYDNPAAWNAIGYPGPRRLPR